MSKTTQTAQQYWNIRSELFANFYKAPSLFDKTFRKAVYFRAAVALKTIKEFSKPTILDIGSGPGLNSVSWLKNSDATFLLGIDFAESMNEYARQAAKAEGVEERCRFIQGDFLTYNFNEQFDVSVAAGVLDYIKDAENFIKKMDIVTAKAFVVSWPEDGLRMMLRRYRYDCPVYHYTTDEIKRLHEGCDLKKLELLDTPGGWVSIARK
jgi:SAM-dependent methyltransferase